MIKLIYGAKGSGKTERIIKAANDEVLNAKGEHVYITDTLMHTMNVDRRIRFVNIRDYSINGEAWFIGFIKGMIAANSDITKVYIDGINRFLAAADDMKNILSEFEKIVEENKVNFTLTVSTPQLSDHLKRYV